MRLMEEVGVTLAFAVPSVILLAVLVKLRERRRTSAVAESLMEKAKDNDSIGTLFEEVDDRKHVQKQDMDKTVLLLLSTVGS